MQKNLFEYLPAATKLWPRLYFCTCLSFCSRGGVRLSACWDTTPPRSRPPLEQTPPRADTPQEQTPVRNRPWEQTPPREQTPPPWEADSGIQSMSGRYVSYWNVFLFALKCGRDEKNFRHEYLVVSQCGRYIEFCKNSFHSDVLY